MVPEFATHYYMADRRPFQNLSDLEGPQFSAVMDGLVLARRAGHHYRPFGQKYMRMRRLVEERLYRLFVERGGQPERRSPHYLVLGESPWFRGLSPDMRDVQIPLRDLPSDQTSVTYPDSFTAMEFGPAFGLPHEPRPYHGQVFRLEELGPLIDRHGLPSTEPDQDYAGFEQRSMEHYIEVQLWSDEPVRRIVEAF